jgi:peptide/nickel transport system substrate-binding protein
MLRAPQVPPAESAGFTITEAVADVGMVIVVDVGGQSVPELAELPVRQAIAHSIDREAWGAAVGQGFGEPTFQFFQEGSPWHLDDWEGYDYDPELARQLLADAGVEPGQIRLEMHTFGPFLLPAQVLQQMFSDVGIQMEIVQIAPGGMLAAFEAGLIPVGYTLMSASHPGTMWDTYFDADLPRNAWSQVAPGAEEARAAVDAAPTDELDAAYQDLLQVIYEEAWGIPVWANSTILGFDAERFPNVHGMDTVTQGISIRELAPSS